MYSVYIGLLIEIIQPYVGRDRSVVDFLYDVLGVVFSIIFFSKPNRTNHTSALLLLVAFLSLATVFRMSKLFLWWKIISLLFYQVLILLKSR